MIKCPMCAWVDDDDLEINLGVHIFKHHSERSILAKILLMKLTFEDALAIEHEKTDDHNLLREKIRALDLQLLLRPTREMILMRDQMLAYWIEKADAGQKEIARLNAEIAEYEQVLDSALEAKKERD